jgi:hypothetical protein
MSGNSPWRKLATSLQDGSAEGRYADEVRARITPEGHLAEVEREIVAEMANALGRSQDKVRTAIARVEEAGRAVDAAPDEAERRVRVERFNELRTLALRARRDLLIHRECIGFRRNDHLETEYPIPPRLI